MAQVNLEITLTTHNITTYTFTKTPVPLDRCNVYEDIRSAYLPNTYSVRLENSMCRMSRMAYESMEACVHPQSYAYRQVFDNSPCPLRYERTNMEEAPKSLFLALAEWEEFYRPLPVLSDAKST